MNAIFKRTSVRKFQDIPVEEEKLNKIIQAAMTAPSGGNQKPWEFYIVTDPEILDQLSHTSRYSIFTKNAPAVIVPCCRSEHLIYPELTTIDMAMAAENILLEAAELHLGGVFLAVYPYEDRMQYVEKILQIPDNLHPFSLIPVGYPIRERIRSDKFDTARIHRK